MASVPAVRKIERTIREEIESGELKTGDKLPTRPELAERYGVATGTVSTAIKRLRESGHLISDTSGVYVSERGTANVANGADRARRVVEENQINAAAEQSRIISTSVVEGSIEICQALEIPQGSHVVRRERLTSRSIAGRAPEPITWSISYLSGELLESCPELAQTENIVGGTAGLIFERTGRKITSGADRMYARGASEDEALLLHIPAGLPVLAGKTLWTDQNGTPIEAGVWILPPGREVSHTFTVAE